MNDTQLIVDVGMHRGDDTAFYLAKGFDVVAVEADPGLVELGRERFADAIGSSRLEILHVAVADHAGTLPFHRSSREGWGSLDAARAGGAIGADVSTVEVRTDTFDHLMEGRRRPYYVKIDIEGADAMCVEGLCRMPELPTYVSFEADLTDAATSTALVRRLSESGYRRFKLVNQALNPTLKAPRPALEGAYVPARFTHEMSGLFGRESPGPWLDAQVVEEALAAVSRQQRLRARYAESGTVLRLPLGWLHGGVRAAYNLRPVTTLRAAYARARGQEMGGWFDVHATLEPWGGS